MATNLEYIYRLRNQYSPQLKKIIRTQIAFEKRYKKSMGKINSALHHNIQKVKEQGRAHREAGSKIRKTIGKSNSAIIHSTKAIRQQGAEHLKTMRRARQSAQTVISLAKKTNAYSRSAENIKRSAHHWNKNAQAIDRARRSQTRMNQAARKQKTSKMGMMQAGTGIGAGFVVKNIVDTATAFELGLNRIKSVSQDPALDMELVRKNAMKWGITTRFSAVQVVNAMAEATQAGMDMDTMFKTMPGNIALAASGQITLVDAMKLSTDVVNQFDKRVGNMRVADVLAKGAATAESIVSELGEAFQNTGKAAFMAGLSVEETSIALMGLGKMGERGAIGGTFFMNFLSQLGNMKSAKIKGFKSFLQGTGVALKDIYDVKRSKFVNFEKFLALLNSADEVKAAQFTKLFDIRAKKAVQSLALLKPEELDKYRKAMNSADGAAIKMAKDLMEGLPGGILLFDSAMETSKLVMIHSFVKPLSLMLRGLANFLVKLSETYPWILTISFSLLALLTTLTGLGLSIMVIGAALKTLKILTMLAAAATWVYNVALGVVTVTFGLNTMALKGNKVALVAARAASYAFAVAQKVLAAGIWAVNAALAANPIGLIIIGIIATIALLVAAVLYAKSKLGSWGESFRFLGQLMLKSMLTPINLIISGIGLLLKAASHLPGKVGENAAMAAESLSKFQDKWNVNLTGNKSLTQAGMAYDLYKSKDLESYKDIATGNVDNAVKSRNQGQGTIKTMVNGNIRVQADPGTKVKEQSFLFQNLGENLSYAQ